MRERETDTKACRLTAVVGQVNQTGRQAECSKRDKWTGRLTDGCGETGKQTGRQAKCSERDRETDRNLADG